jgi:phage shock protein PspC (stress-responsive transcriptional regulator)
MAQRRGQQSSQRQSNQPRQQQRRRSSGRAPVKSREEARIERLTWLAMAGVFILLSMFDPDNRLPDYAVAFTIAGILLMSGIYQFMQTSWRVSPFTWMLGFTLLVFATFGGLGEYYNWSSRIPVDLRLVSLAVVVVIILLGIITNEA